jgi:hypothetical protein
MSKRKSWTREDPADEVIKELNTAIDMCARAAEAELRQRQDGADMLQMLPELVELLKDTNASQSFGASALKDLTLFACRSRSSELAKIQEQERQEFAAAEQQDRAELKAIEARIREVRREAAAERRCLNDFQVFALLQASPDATLCSERPLPVGKVLRCSFSDLCFCCVMMMSRRRLSRVHGNTGTSTSGVCTHS